MGKDKIEEVKMEVNCLVDLIVPLRFQANWTKRELSRGIIGDIIPVDDFDIMEFLQILQKMKQDDDPATLVISDIEWENYYNCAGDELYPVIMEAQLLPGAKRRFYVTVSSLDSEHYQGWDKKEYIWYPPEK